MKLFQVTLPIAGHASLEVEAETKEEAIEKAFDEVTLQMVDDWEALREFTRGNICYCPTPWSVETDDGTDI